MSTGSGTSGDRLEWKEMTENCTYAVPDYVVSIFWVFACSLMLFVIGAILFAGLKVTCEFIEDRRRTYLANKRIKLQNELLEKQKNET